MSRRRIVIGISGASGAAYACRVIECLAAADVEVHVTISTYGRRLLADELDIRTLDPDLLSNGRGERLVIHNDSDLGSTVASGSFRHDGMIIIPCSSNTMGAVAAGISNNLLQRAATVTLKERRPLILAYRESPMSHIDLLNATRLSEAGAIIAPLAPGFYLRPEQLDEIIDFMAGKMLDLVGVDHDLDTRWESQAPPAAHGRQGDMV